MLWPQVRFHINTYLQMSQFDCTNCIVRHYFFCFQLCFDLSIYFCVFFWPVYITFALREEKLSLVMMEYSKELLSNYSIIGNMEMLTLPRSTRLVIITMT